MALRFRKSLTGKGQDRFMRRSKKRKVSDKENKGESTLFLGARKALIGGILAACIALGGQWLIGQVYTGFEARRFLETMIPTTRTLCFAIITASSTILALMLTLLSVTDQVDSDFDETFYRRVERIGLLSTITLITAVLLLLFINMPLQESEELPSSWFTTIYYVVLSFSAAIAGLLVAVVLMLFNTISGLIDALCPSPEDDEKEQDEDDF